MHEVVEAVNRWGAEWTTLVVALAWQSTLVALVVACAAYAIAPRSPSLRYWLWQIVAIKLLIVPVWSWSLPLPRHFAESTAMPRITARADPLPGGAGGGILPVNAAESGAQTVLTRPTIAPPPSGALARLTWRGWIFAGWGAIVLAQVGRLVAQRARLARLLRKTRAGDDRLVGAVGQVAARMKLKRAPRVVTTEVDCSPFVCGIVRATLVLPRELAETLGAADLGQIIAHELAHIKRRDLVWVWIPQIARMLYFFHPVAHLASYRIRLERELACDQLAMIDCGRAPGEYAATLVRVLSSASRPGVFRTSAAAPLDGGAAPTGNLEQRP